MATNLSNKLVSGSNLKDTLALFKDQFNTDILDNLGVSIPVKYSDFILRKGTNGEPDLYTCEISHTLKSKNVICKLYDLSDSEEWCIIEPLDENIIKITNDRRISGIVVIIKE